MKRRSRGRVALSIINANLLYFGTMWGACVARARADEPLAEFNMTFEEEHVQRLIVPVIFGGKQYHFSIDTGSATSTFGIHLRSLLGRPRGRSRYYLPLGTEVMTEYNAPRGFIGRVVLPPLNGVSCRELIPWGVPTDLKLDGVLGVDALRTSVVRFDFDGGRLSFLSSVPQDAGAALRRVNEGPIPIVPANIGGYGARLFVIDTGFNGGAALESADFGVLLARRQLVAAGTFPVTSFDRTSVTRAGVLAVPLTVGNDSHSSLACAELHDTDSPISAGLLGLDFLSRYTVTIDFPRGVVYLKPGATFRSLRPVGGLGGVRLARIGENLVVFSVANKSRVSAHARPNDILETLNGASAMSLSDDEIVRILTDASTKRELKFRRPSDESGWFMVLHPDAPRRPPARGAPTSSSGSHPPTTASRGVMREAAPTKRFGLRR